MRSGSVRVITAPMQADIDALLPVDELRAHCNITTTDFDSALIRFARTAFDWIHAPGGWLGRSVLPQMLRIDIPRWPCDGETIPLLAGPVSDNAITGVTYFDLDNIERALAANEWFQEGDGTDASLILARPFTSPALYCRPGAVRVSYAAGYQNPDAVPTGIKQAILMLVAHWQENREEVSVIGPLNMIPVGAMDILATLRVWV